MRAQVHSICNLLDSEVLTAETETLERLVSMSHVDMKAMGVSDGSRIWVIDKRTGRSTDALVFESKRFKRPGLDLALREYFELPLHPPSNPGTAPLRNLTLKFTPFQYEHALSFAGEDRGIVREIAETLQAAGIRVFYDEFDPALLLGRYLLDFLEDTYGKRAEYCPVFWSSHYKDKAWPRYENRAIRSAAFSQDRVILLPIRLDNEVPPGQLEHIGALDARQLPVGQIAQILIDKVSGPST